MAKIVFWVICTETILHTIFPVHFARMDINKPHAKSTAYFEIKCIVTHDNPEEKKGEKYNKAHTNYCGFCVKDINMRNNIFCSSELKQRARRLYL